MKIILVNRLLIAVKSCPECGGDLFLEYKEKWYKCFGCSRYFFRFLGREVTEAKKVFEGRKKKLEELILQNLAVKKVRVSKVSSKPTPTA